MKHTYSYGALALAVLLMPVCAFSQTYLMTDGLTINTCGGTFYDDGGPGGTGADNAPNNYINNKLMTETFCSCNNSPIRFTFTAFNTEAGYDSLIVYNGANILAPKLGGYHGPVNPGVIESSNTGNCLTFFFQSDLNENRLGWAANISCTGSASTITASGPTTFCPGNDVTLTASSGSSYSWNTGSTSQSIVVTTAGSYYASVTNGTCPAATPPVTVTVKSTPTVTVTGAATICAGTSTSLKATGAASYSWAPAASLTNPNISNPYASPSATTTYSVTGTGANGCTSMGTVKVTTKSAPVVTISGDSVICAGDSTTLSGSGTGTYMWSTGQTTTDIVVSPSASATYSLQVMGSNGCSGKGQATVTVNQLPATPIITPNGTILSSSSGAGNQWYLNSVAINGATAQTYSVSQNGMYSVCVTDTNGCSSCSAGYNFTVTGISPGLGNILSSISPNPTTGKFSLQLGEQEQCVVQITDALGRVVQRNDHETGILEIDLSGEKNGIYFLTLTSFEGTGSCIVVVYR